MIKEHNVEVYNNLVNAVNEGYRSICIIHGTGLGKSFLVLELLKLSQFSGKKVLWVTRKYTSDIISTNDNSIDFVTYNMFNSEDRVSEISKRYDILILDECHHIGSPIFGNFANRTMTEITNRGGLCIGLTATPRRSCDGIDSSMMFDYVINGIDILDAIIKGYCKPIKYRICVDEDTKSILENSNKQEIEKIDFGFEFDRSVDAVNKIVFNEEYHKRWLIVCNTIKECNHVYPDICKLFPNHKIEIVNSKRKIDITEYMYNDDPTVFISVMQLSEGVHIPYVDALLIIRNIRSESLFLQFIGRIMHLNSEISPLVIDCRRDNLIQSYNLKTYVEKTTKSKKKKCSIKDVIEYDANSIIVIDSIKLLQEMNITSKYNSYKELYPDDIISYDAFNGSYKYRIDKFTCDEDIFHDIYNRNRVNKSGISQIYQKYKELYPDDIISYKGFKSSYKYRIDKFTCDEDIFHDIYNRAKKRGIIQAYQKYKELYPDDIVLYGAFKSSYNCRIDKFTCDEDIFHDIYNRKRVKVNKSGIPQTYQKYKELYPDDIISYKGFKSSYNCRIDKFTCDEDIFCSIYNRAKKRCIMQAYQKYKELYPDDIISYGTFKSSYKYRIDKFTCDEDIFHDIYNRKRHKR